MVLYAAVYPHSDPTPNPVYNLSHDRYPPVSGPLGRSRSVTRDCRVLKPVGQNPRVERPSGEYGNATRSRCCRETKRPSKRLPERCGVSSPPALPALDALDRLWATLTGSCRPATRSVMSRVLPGWVELQYGNQAEHDAGGDHCGVRIHIVHTRTGCRRRESSSAPLRLVVGPAQNGENS